MNLLEEATTSDLEKELARRREHMQSITKKFTTDDDIIIEISADASDICVSTYMDNDDYRDECPDSAIEICHSSFDRFIRELEMFKGELRR